MMNDIYIGKIVNTHGIRGELRILSDFPFKERVFRAGNKLLIDNQEFIIRSYRKHKNFDMVTLGDFKNINDVLFLLRKKVYFSRRDLKLLDNEVLDEDLITFKALTNKGKTGIIEEIFLASRDNKILRVMFDKEVLIPFNSPMIVGMDKNKKELYVELIDGME